MLYRAYLLVVLSILLSANLAAQQLAFRKTDLSYQYHWLQKSNEERHLLNFILNNNGFKFSRFLNYRPQNVQRYVETKLKQHAKTYDPKLVQFRFTHQYGKLSMQLKGADGDLLKEIHDDFSKLTKSAELEYLKNNYYHYFTDNYGEKVIKPDHLRIIKDSQQDLLPISDAFISLAEGKKQRYLLELILSFVQSIPYDNLRSRDGLRGAGFLPPVSLISGNRGDCDSKAALMLGLLKNIYPDTAMALIFVPEHAFIALNVGAKLSDKTIVLGGVVYVVADPTGPRQIDFGQVSKESAHYLESGLIQYELINKL